MANVFLPKIDYTEIGNLPLCSSLQKEVLLGKVKGIGQYLAYLERRLPQAILCWYGFQPFKMFPVNLEMTAPS